MLILLGHKPLAMAMGRAIISLPNGWVLEAELATTASEREYGLMHRPQLSANQAMLLTYPDSGRRAVWMKNMRIPLDVLFLSEDGKIVGMKSGLPPCAGSPCSVYESGVAARYILEMNAGIIEQTGLKPGDELTIDYRHDTPDIKPGR
ncbi:MAG: DUF192 domain-containing protein [Methylomonas sp.]|nr:DUF192 domain-containing protein [Methylomonas sp.]